MAELTDWRVRNSGHRAACFNRRGGSSTCDSLATPWRIVTTASRLRPHTNEVVHRRLLKEAEEEGGGVALQLPVLNSCRSLGPRTHSQQRRAQLTERFRVRLV